MAHDQALGKRIWEGDMSAIAEARKRFADDPIGQLIPWASTLYSFRRNPKCVSELKGLSEQLSMRAYEFRLRQGVDYWSDKRFSDEADTLSTILEWMSRDSSITHREAFLLRDLVFQLCEKGKAHLEKYGEVGHTWCLLELTRARAFLAQPLPKAARSSLQAVRESLYTIEDQRQCARVYRKLGFLQRKMFIILPGFWWGIVACLVPGVPLDVRKKSLATLIGVDTQL